MLQSHHPIFISRSFADDLKVDCCFTLIRFVCIAQSDKIENFKFKTHAHMPACYFECLVRICIVLCFINVYIKSEFEEICISVVKVCSIIEIVPFL